jgi:hypothetical protein
MVVGKHEHDVGEVTTSCSRKRTLFEWLLQCLPQGERYW